MPAANRSIVLVYATLVAIWATTPLAIVWSVQQLAPLWGLLLRFLLALPVLVLLLAALRIRLPLNRRALLSYLAGSCSMAICQLFVYLSTVYLSSGMIALMFGFAPVVAGLIGWLVFGIALRPIQWLGLAVAIAGLGLICLKGGEARLHPIGLLYMSVSLLVYGGSIYWVKHINAAVTPMAQAGGSIIVSLLFCCLLLPFIWNDRPMAIPDTRSVLALAYISTVATILGMLCYFKLVQSISAATLSLTTVITPVFAIAIGILFNGEHVHATLLLGCAAVVLGLILYFWRSIFMRR